MRILAVCAAAALLQMLSGCATPKKVGVVSTRSKFGDVWCRSCPAPAYPQKAVENNQAGTVKLDVLIGVDGKVRSLFVSESSGHPLLDHSAINAVKNWEFKPKKVAGLPVSGTVEIPISFDLELPPH